MNNFNGTTIQTLVILIVVFFAFITYRLQVISNYRNIALMLLTEIRDIEKELDNLKKIEDYYYSNPILSSNTWEKYKHMFVKYLGQDDYNTINEFYLKAKRIEDERKVIKKHIDITLEEKAKMYQWINRELILKNNCTSTPEYDKDISAAGELLSRPSPEFNASLPKNLTKKLLLETRYMTSTIAFNKLEKASNKKWYTIR